MAAQFDLAGARIAITGAGGGIGTETAKLVAEMGADVLLSDIEAPGPLADYIASKGRETSATALDVTDRAAVEAWAADCGAVTALIDCAAICPFDDWNDGELDHLIAYITDFPPNGPLAAAAERTSMEGMAGMIAGNASSMQDVVSMQSMASHIKAASQSENKIPSTGDIAGQFRITPTGEILLNPINQDLRAVAGLSGDFKITPGGIVFVPR